MLPLCPWCGKEMGFVNGRLGCVLAACMTDLALLTFYAAHHRWPCEPPDALCAKMRAALRGEGTDLSAKFVEELRAEFGDNDFHQGAY